MSQSPPISPLPAIEQLFANGPTIYSSLDQVPDAPQWSGKGAVPLLGQVVQVEGWGPAVVLGFLTKDGWLGLWAKALNPPAARVGTNKGSDQGDVYGRELQWELVSQAQAPTLAWQLVDGDPGAGKTWQLLPVQGGNELVWKLR